MKILQILLTFLFIFTDIPANGFDRYGGTIRIAGGTAHIPVMKVIAKEIRASNPGIHISIAGGGSGVGIKKVGEGLVDIGNSGRQVGKAEIERYGLVPLKWAIDGIAVIIHPDNPLEKLTLTQVRDIFSGKIKNWKELGGPDAPIHLFTRDEASGTRKVFWKKLLNKTSISSRANFVPSNGAMKRAISSDPYAIGYISAGFIDKNLKGVAIDDIFPTRENITSGKYPYARGLYSITKGQPKGIKKAFMDYLLSDHVQHDIIPSKGFIPVL